MSRPEATRHLVRSAIAVDKEWERAKRIASEEGRRPDQLTSENEG